MPPPASRCFPPRRPERGVLLVEAALSAVVIAVGLTFITRALGSQLKALQRVEEYAVLRDVAQQALRTMEVDVQAGKPPRGPQDGFFDAPYQTYQWALSATALDDRDLPFEMSRVTLSVHRADRSSATYSVQAVWPTSVVPPEWL